MIQIKEYDENAFKGYQIKLKDGRFPSNDKEIVLSEESLKKSNKKIGENILMTINYNLVIVVMLFIVLMSIQFTLNKIYVLLKEIKECYNK